jgi:hypothetical protein
MFDTRKIKWRPALLSLGISILAAGCGISKENIRFSDEAEIKAQSGALAGAMVQINLQKADEMKIEEAVFGYLLERRFWDLADYSSVFLQADDAEVAAIIAKYPNHYPPVKRGDHVDVQLHHTPVDRDTGKPAMILTAEVNEPNADGSVDAVGRWYAGDAVTGFRTFHFRRTADGWEISEIK